MKIAVAGGILRLSEEELREIVACVDEAHEKFPEFKDEPMPDGDTTFQARAKLMLERGVALIRQPFGNFHVEVDMNRQEVESFGKYQLLGVIEKEQA